MIVNTYPGFTLIEMVIVLALIGILSVVAMPNTSFRSINTNYEALRVLNDVRYAQELSINAGIRYRWVRTSSNTYQIVNANGSAMVLPSGGTSYTLAAGVSFGTLSNLPNSLVNFNSLGAPYIDTGTPGTLLAATASIPVTGAGVTRSITITPTTGYTQLS